MFTTTNLPPHSGEECRWKGVPCGPSKGPRQSTRLQGGKRIMFGKLLIARARKVTYVLPWLVLSGALFGQGNSGNAPGGGPANNGQRLSLPQDWSDHSVIFSQPAGQQKGSQPSQDPRYWKQYAGRNLAGTRNANVTNPAAGNGGGKKNPPPPA